MAPFLFERWIGDWALIPTYGVALAFAFTVAYVEAIRRTLLCSEPPKHTEKLFLIAVLGSLLGARLFHVLFEEPLFYLSHPERVLAFWEGGFTFYGGALVTTGGIYLYCHLKELNFLKWMDIITPAALLGVGLGRLGCLAAGCCWGLPTDLPWRVTFSHPQTMAGIRHTPLHPTQVYEAVGALLLFFGLQRRFRKPHPAGAIFAAGLCGYAALRFVVEFFRGDLSRGFLFGGALSTSQFLSLAWLLLVATAVWYRSRAWPFRR